jgi:outer membrane protein assembly factor BamB
MIGRLSLLAALAVAWLVQGAQAQDNWPRFRGPHADGVAPDRAGLPTRWTNTENVKWVADVPGWGWSSPIVWGGRVFVTSVVSDEKNITPSKGLYRGEGVRDPAKGVHHWLVYCFELNTGKQLWKQEAHTGRPRVPRHPKSTYASETPTTDGQRLYVLFGDLGLFCYDLNGQPLWSRKIEPRKTFLDYGAASSPVVHDGQVIVVYDNLENSWIAAFDAKTGGERWRTPRDETHSWATPLIWRNEVRTEIVVPGKKRNRGYSLDGRLLWEFDGGMSNLVIPSPFAAHGLCYVASGYVGDAHRPTFALRPGARGDFTPKDGENFAQNPHVQWYQGKSAPYNTSQLVSGDYLYTLYDMGFLTCHDARTGKQIFGKQRFSPRGSFTSSPWAYKGYLFCLSEDGLTYVVKVGPEFKISARNELSELCLASPAIVQDKLLIRTASKLYCITGGASAKEIAGPEHPDEKPSPSMEIWTAAAEGKLDAVKQNLAAGTSVNARNPQGGATPLNTAALFGKTAVAAFLIEKGADVSIANKDGNTALHLAAFFAYPDLVEMLLKQDASILVKNARGETPLDLVSSGWSPELEKVYTSIANLLDMQIDLARIKEARPKIAKLLRDRTKEK